MKETGRDKLTLRNRLGYLLVEKEHWKNYLLFYLGNKKGQIPHLIKRRVIKNYAEKYNIGCFVETGTYIGDMLKAMSKHFNELYSIELSEFYYKKAVKRFSNDPNIHLFHGDSGIILRNILDLIKHPTVFWLDAHYSGGNTARGKTETPILNELEEIINHHNEHVILIDDARCFHGPEGYPSISKLEKFVKDNNVNYNFVVSEDIIHIITKQYRLTGS